MKTTRRSREQVSNIMKKVRSTGNEWEVRFRKALWEKGIRYRLYNSDLPGNPDIVIKSKNILIFIDGEYWHGGQWYRRGHACLEDQFQNYNFDKKQYWITKTRKNINRDIEQTSDLLNGGWKIMRFWEGDLKADLESCVQATLDFIEAEEEKVEAGISILPEKSFAEFFAGIGLMRLGLERCGWSCKYANDIDEKKYEMYRTHYRSADHFHIDDIHRLSAGDVPRVTLATASFPCNDLSIAGSRCGLKGKQSSAYWGFTRILAEMKERKPTLVLLENVAGFLSSNEGGDFKDAIAALNDLGYYTDAFIIDAVHFVPQSRKRLFVVGMLEDGNDDCRFDTNSSILPLNSVRNNQLLRFIVENPDLKWSLRRLPELPQSRLKLDDVLEDIPHESDVWWNRNRAEYLFNQMSEKHKNTAHEMISRDSWSYGTVFRRIRNKKSMAELRTDGIAGCLRTPRGGSARQILFKAGYGEYHVRLLTPRECARLMGADDFNMDTGTTQALFGLGDAVCVPVIEWIARNYLQPVITELIRGAPLFRKTE